MDGLHELTVEELEAGCKAMTARVNELDALAYRMKEIDQSEAAHALGLESNNISVVHGVLLMALRDRRREDREAAYLARGK